MSTIRCSETEALFPPARLKVLELLFAEPEREFYLREIIRGTRLGHGSVQRELERLSGVGILLRRKSGNRTYFKADRESSTFQAVISLLRCDAAPGPDLPEILTGKSALIEEICRRHHVSRLKVFGSTLRQDQTEDSDIDLLVEFEPGRVPGLDFFELQEELSDAIGREVDLNTPGFLNRDFRDQVLAEAREIYAAG